MILGIASLLAAYAARHHEHGFQLYQKQFVALCEPSPLLLSACITDTIYYGAESLYDHHEISSSKVITHTTVPSVQEQANVTTIVQEQANVTTIASRA